VRAPALRGQPVGEGRLGEVALGEEDLDTSRRDGGRGRADRRGRGAGRPRPLGQHPARRLLAGGDEVDLDAGAAQGGRRRVPDRRNPGAARAGGAAGGDDVGQGASGAGGGRLEGVHGEAAGHRNPGEPSAADVGQRVVEGRGVVRRLDQHERGGDRLGPGPAQGADQRTGPFGGAGHQDAQTGERQVGG
jgi:hypothetical protein